MTFSINFLIKFTSSHRTIFMGKDPLECTKPLPNLQAWIIKSHLVTFLINCHTLIEVAIKAKNAIFSAIFEQS